MAGPFACFSRPALIVQLQQLANKFCADSAIAAPDFNVGKNYLKLLRVCPDTGRAVPEMAVLSPVGCSSQNGGGKPIGSSNFSGFRRTETIVGSPK
jgi:hypothetical protein